MKKRFILSGLLALSIIGCSTPMVNTNQDFSALEKEYKSFSTKALSDAYVKRMFGKYLAPVNSVQLTRQLEFSRYLKANSDLTYETSLKTMFSQTPLLYDQMTAIGTISDKMSTESATFGNYVIGLSPYPAVPLATSSTNIAATSFTANWNASNRATGYKLFVDGIEVYSGSNTSFSVTGLTTGATYNYYVKSFNNAGNSGNSNTVSVVLNPAVPVAPTTNAATNITQTSFTANWNTVSGATSYKLKVDSGAYTDVGNVSSFNVTGLTAGTTHTYSVQSVNSSGTSAASSNRSVSLLPSTPNAPVATAATLVTQTSFTANWSSVSGATGYILFIDGGQAYSGSALSYNKTGLTAGTSHSYHVQAFNTGGTSGNSNTISLSNFISTIPNDWTLVAGSWQFNSDNIIYNGGINGARIIKNNLSVKNFTFSTKVKFSSTQSCPAIVFRVNGDNVYQFEWRALNSEISIGKLSPGYTYLATSTYVAPELNRWYEFKVVTHDNNIKCYIDNVLYFDVNDSSFTDPGSVGLSLWDPGLTSFKDILLVQE